MKVSQRAKAEYEFYLRTDLDMIGEVIGQENPAVLYDPSGLSALECWYALDTHGRQLACREPDQLAKALRSKASVNLQIKLWAEDVADGMILPQDDLFEYLHGWPEWCLRAVMEQAAKLTRKTFGFVPRFARIELLLGNPWPPHMDRFNPAI